MYTVFALFDNTTPINALHTHFYSLKHPLSTIYRNENIT